jgi:hypothetical protein
VLIPDGCHVFGRPVSNSLACPVRLFTFRIDCLQFLYSCVGIHRRFLRIAEMLWTNWMIRILYLVLGIFCYVGVSYVAWCGRSTEFNDGTDDTLLVFSDPCPPQILWRKSVIIAHNPCSKMLMKEMLRVDGKRSERTQKWKWDKSSTYLNNHGRYLYTIRGSVENCILVLFRKGSCLLLSVVKYNNSEIYC